MRSMFLKRGTASLRKSLSVSVLEKERITRDCVPQYGTCQAVQRRSNDLALPGCEDIDADVQQRERHQESSSVKNIFVTSAYMTTAKIFFSTLVDKRCERLAPQGAAAMLAMTNPINAGRYT